MKIFKDLKRKLKLSKSKADFDTEQDELSQSKKTGCDEQVKAKKYSVKKGKKSDRYSDSGQKRRPRGKPNRENPRKKNSPKKPTLQMRDHSKPMGLGFNELGLNKELLKAVHELGYTNPSPIQQGSIPALIEGRDLLGIAQTGTGKTASFALPTLQLLAQSQHASSKIRVLALTPTRELAIQVAESYENYGKHLKLKTAVVYGGVKIQSQIRSLKHGCDILVATPGRLLDLSRQGFVDFKDLKILILDEADRMLDMGFLPDVKRIIGLLPRKRQNILFSATMPKDINDLSMNLLKNPVKVEVAAVSSTSDQVEQTVYFVNRSNKQKLLLHIHEDPSTYKILVFVRTKAIANRVVKLLQKNKIAAEAIHSNKSQNARQRALQNFSGEKTRTLVASDIAARGLDVDDITHVINYDLPNIPETYVHRIGRTGRAAATGKAISFCDGEERPYLKGIEKLIGKKIPVVKDHPFPFKEAEEKNKQTSAPNQSRNGSKTRRPGTSRKPLKSHSSKKRPS